MKITVFSDVHGNIFALKKFFKTEDYKNADIAIFLGDIINRCPYPNQCLKLIKKKKPILILGNGDSYFLNGIPSEEYKVFHEYAIKHLKQVNEDVKSKYKNFYKNFLKEHFLEISGKKFYFTHYLWEKEDLICDLPKKFSDKIVSEVFKNIDADYIIYGHEHTPRNNEVENKKFVCVGSLGAIYPGNYLNIEILPNDVKIERRKIEYNIKKLRKKLIKSGGEDVKKHLKDLFLQ